MRTCHPPRLALALLVRWFPDNEPLAGDLLEACRDRSRAWFWRQVLLAIAARAMTQVRTNPRPLVETSLVSLAMLALLGFHAVVAASLINHLFLLNDPAWAGVTGRYHDWQVPATTLSFGAAVLLGREIGRFHRDHRVAAVLAFSASATLGAFFNLYLFVSTRTVPFVTDPVLQTAISMVFIAGLFVGVGSRSLCEPLPS